MRSKAPPLATVLLLGLEGALGLVNCYLLALLAAASAGRTEEERREPAGSARLRFVVVVPAHNEEAGIKATLASLLALDYPPDRFALLVVADNCGDRTAAVALEAGVTVWTRADRSRRGKGHALAWAFERVLRERPEVDAVAVVDADCEASPDLLSAMDLTLRRGAPAVQVDNVVSNPCDSAASALRYAAFALMNTVRPRGKSRLGLSAGLLGTGMAFTRSLLDRQPWTAFSIAEDREYHLGLVAAGERVAFACEASVRGPMPTSLVGASQQQLRWEGGAWAAAREWTPKLLKAAVRERDRVRLHAALEPLVPPQTLLAVGHLTLAAGAIGLRSHGAAGLGALNLATQLSFVLGGLRLTGAPAEAYRALAVAPILMIHKLPLYARLVAGRGPTAWVRTARAPATSEARQALSPSARGVGQRTARFARPSPPRPKSKVGGLGRRTEGGRGWPPPAN